MNKSSGFISLIIGLFMLFVLSPAYAAFQAPQTNRVKMNFDINWKFNRGDVSGAEAAAFSDAAWSTVHLPHNFQTLPITGGTFYRGIGWYRRHFTLDNTYANKIITLYFEGAMTVTQVWINGQTFPIHYGGFSPFCFDITSGCKFDGTDNVIAVKLDNTYQKQVPPEHPDGSTTEFELYGGIYRDVYLIATDKLYVPPPIHTWLSGWTDQGGTFISYPSVSASSATVKVNTWVKNATGAVVASCKLSTYLVDATGNTVQTVETTQSAATTGVTLFSQTMTVSSPQLWFPWAPKLYTVYTVVSNGVTAVDMISTQVGIRQVTYNKASGVYCNGTYFKILGVNRHQMWPFVGHAVPNIQQRRDAQRLKEIGCNFVRCSHYLQDDAWLDECDRLGIFLWEEIPGWHCCTNGGVPPPDTAWRRRHYDETRFLVRTARNHPSIMIWAPAINEATSDPTIERPLNDLCHQEDSTRPTSAGRLVAPQGAGSNIYDFYAENCFTPGSLPNANPDPNTIGFLNTEHTGYTYQDSSIRATCPEWSLVGHAERHAIMTEQGRQRAWQAGSVGWCGYDYYTNRETTGMKRSGVFDMMRIRKFATYFYQSQSAADNYDGSVHPMVHIASYNRSDSPLDRKVYSNCDQVKLYQNGVLVATQSPDAGRTLAHPPFTFKNVAYAAGTMRAEGLIGGVVVARDSVKSPLTASALRLIADPDTIEANGGDFSRVEAYVIDANGTWVQYTTNSITWSITGQGDLVGDNPIAAQSGACITLAKARLVPGTLTVTGSASGLAPATATIVVKGVPTNLVSSSVTNMHPIQGTVKVVKAIGSRLMVPGPAAMQWVMVYDLTGNLLFKKKTSQRTIDLRKEIGKAEGAYFVKVNPLQ
jgi:hypothetical protein